MTRFAAAFNPDGAHTGSLASVPDDRFPTDADGVRWVEVSEAQARAMRSTPFPGWELSGSPDGTLEGNDAAISQVVDPRPLVRFGYRLNGGGWTTPVGAPGNPLTVDEVDTLELVIELVNEQGSRLGFTGTRRLEIGGRLVRVDMTDGLSQVFTVDTSASRRVQWGDTQALRVVAPVVIDIYDASTL